MKKRTKKADIPILVTGKADFMSKRIVTDTGEHFIMKKSHFCQEDKRMLNLTYLILQTQNRAKVDRITRRNKQTRIYSGSEKSSIHFSQ